MTNNAAAHHTLNVDRKMQGNIQIRRIRALLFKALLVGQISVAVACHIAGTDSGICMNPADFEDEMSFCRSVVRYPACVPLQFVSLFSRGKLFSLSHSIQLMFIALQGGGSQAIADKDRWVRDTVNEVISERIDLENNSTLRDRGKARRQANYW